MINISGQTNVSSLRIGKGSLKGIGRELGRFIIVTMDIPWQVTRHIVGGAPESVVMVETVDEIWLNNQLSKVPVCDAIVGIGGGQAVDAAKYFSWKRGVRLVTVPTIISVDAFVTPAAGIRKDHQVIYVGESTPDPLIVDYNVIRSAPPEMNIAGIGDLLSMHTATYDWELAEKIGKSEYPFSADDVRTARGILYDLYSDLSEIRNNTDKGLRAIIEGYMRLNTICLPAGHYRVEEGSEHYLFYELEERLKRPFIHGYIVGLGIYLMSQLQNNGFKDIKEIMDSVGLLYDPVNMKIKYKDLVNSLLNLRQFVGRKPDLWYTVIDDSNITLEWIESALDGLKF
jgi:glycerol-1-phosphate dehydrogenase [NAD(P)+]